MKPEIRLERKDNGWVYKLWAQSGILYEGVMADDDSVPIVLRIVYGGRNFAVHVEEEK
jgi:hypothetical protein